MNTKDLLRDEIKSILAKMRDTEMGSDEYKLAVESVTKLIDRLDEMEKIELQYAELATEEKHREKELKLKQDQLEVEKKVHEDDKAFKAQQAVEERHKMIVNIVLTSLGIVVPTGLTIWGTYKTFKFEETGTVTTTMGRGFINRLFHKK